MLSEAQRRRHQFQEDGSHYNGGAVFFGYGYRAIGEPRLHMVRRWYRQGKRRGETEDHFSVDGDRVDSYEEALDALKKPPVFSKEELDALSRVGDEPADHREAIDWTVLHYLSSKGAIEWGPPGSCKRTPAGLSALEEQDNG